MPRLNGADAARKLHLWQREGLAPPFPILAATSGVAGAEERDGGEADMGGMLVTPFELGQSPALTGERA